MNNNIDNINTKYYIIKDKDLAVTIETLSGQHPFEFPHNFKAGSSVYSFVNDDKFKEIYKIVMDLLHKNNR